MGGWKAGLREAGECRWAHGATARPTARRPLAVAEANEVPAVPARRKRCAAVG